MKKILTVFLISFMVSYLTATTSRINSLGVDPWMIEKDDSFLWVNPARVVDYKKHFFCELGEASAAGNQVGLNNNLSISQRWGGVVYPLNLLSENSVLGVFVGRPYFSFLSQVGEEVGDVDSVSGLGRTSIDVTQAGAVSINTLLPINKVDIIYYMPSFTLWFNYANNIEERTYTYEGAATSGTVKVERASVEFNLYAGKVFKNVGPFSEVDASLGIGFPYVNNLIEENVKTVSPTAENEEHSLKTNSAFNLDLNLRGIYSLSNKSKVLLFLTYYLSNLPNSFTSKVDSNRNNAYETAETLRQKRDQKYSNVLFTSALNTEIANTNIVLAFSVFNINTYALASQFSNDSKEEEFEILNQYIYLPINLAFEKQFIKVLTGRLGIRYNLFTIESVNIKDPDNFVNGQSTRETKRITTSSSADQEVTISLGIGLNITNYLILDAVVRQQVLFTGTYLVSGVPETLNSSLSLVYKF